MAQMGAWGRNPSKDLLLRALGHSLRGGAEPGWESRCLEG